MEALFTQYDESPIIYEREPESDPPFEPEPRRTKTHLVIANLIKYGINLQVSEAVFDHIAAALVVGAPGVFTTRRGRLRRLARLEPPGVEAVRGKVVLGRRRARRLGARADQDLRALHSAKRARRRDRQEVWRQLFGAPDRLRARLRHAQGRAARLLLDQEAGTLRRTAEIPRVVQEGAARARGPGRRDRADVLDSLPAALRGSPATRQRCRGFNFNEWIGVESHTYVQLVPVDSVSSSSTGRCRATPDVQLLIGNLARCKDGDLCLQGAIMELKIRIAGDVGSLTAQCKVSRGIYCYGQVVIAFGNMITAENTFNVRGLTQPPVTAKNYLSHLNLFGGTHSPLELVRHAQPQNLFNELTKMPSLKNIGSKWVVVSDFYLDKPESVAALEQMFNSYVENYHVAQLPTGFVFMGNFNSLGFNFDSQRAWTDHLEHRGGAGPGETYAGGFEALFKLLTKPKFLMIVASRPRQHAGCYLVFVPGPKDATLCRQRIPRNPLLSFATNRFKERLESSRPECKGRVVMASNPCRIRHWGRQMVFFRHDLLTQLLIDSMATSSSAEQTDACDDLVDMVPRGHAQLVETLVGQSHLSPNRPGLSTILDHDAALLLHPLPDFVGADASQICLGDTTAPAFIRYHGPKNNCLVANCGTSGSRADPNSRLLKNVITYDSTANQVNLLSL